MKKRWLCPVDRVSKEKLKAAGIHVLNSVREYEIWPVDKENPILIPGDLQRVGEQLKAAGENIEYMKWDEGKKCWFDPISE